ncbi:Fc receptor-like protein 4 [Mixophyes fleayi]|uniref:Fc receptor-like protein 4 n=1 Tax=Mixophyes fleayi TaxID=3061075 RepID=UPI003F4D9DCA
MSLLVLMMLVSLNSGDAAISLEIRNNQSSITEGDDLALTCVPESKNTKHQFGFFKQAKNNKFDNRVQEFSSSDTYRVPSAQPEDSGNYKCAVRTYKTGPWKMSNVSSVKIEELFSSPKMKMAPNTIIEGNNMILTCDTTLAPLGNTTELEFAFYKTGQNVQEFNLFDTYRDPSVHLEDSGNYYCEVRTSSGSVRKRSNVLSIQIEELFSYPKIKMVPSTIIGGENMTLTCDTTLAPLRDTTILEFAFYRDGRNVQEFNLSATYRVLSAQLEDSGNYYCEVRTITSNVRKRSNVLYIQIEDYTVQNTIRLVLSGCVLVVAACLIFYHNQSQHEAVEQAAFRKGVSQQEDQLD